MPAPAAIDGHGPASSRSCGLLTSGAASGMAHRGSRSSGRAIHPSEPHILAPASPPPTTGAWIASPESSYAVAGALWTSCGNAKPFACEHRASAGGNIGANQATTRSPRRRLAIDNAAASVAANRMRTCSFVHANRTIRVTVLTRTSAKPAASNRARNSAACLSECSCHAARARPVRGAHQARRRPRASQSSSRLP